MAEEFIGETEFQYPLLLASKASIRLLKLLYTDEAHAKTLCYEIQTFELEQCPPYKALSYTWGSPFPLDQVLNPTDTPYPSDEELQERDLDWGNAKIVTICNGGPVKVSQNLFDALSRLLNLGERGLLWVDRLCIDQGNTLEKSSQIALMDKIYSKATTVIVWLGRDGRDSIAALQIQKNFAGPIYALATAGELSRADLESHSPDDMSIYGEFGLAITYPQTWFLWTQFFRRSWFYRRWTLQETALARHIDVLCGDQQFDWYKLKFLVDYFNISGWKTYLQRFISRTENQPSKALMSRMFVESVSSDPEDWKNKCFMCYGAFNSGTVLTELLYRSSMLQCSDPRDIIYAILGILENMPQSQDTFNISVDYNIDAAELFSGVTKFCLEKVPDLAILSLVRYDSPRLISNLPSWVPDLYGLSQHLMDRRLGLNRRLSDTLLYNAGYANQEVPICRSVQGRVLYLRGFHLGKLAVCGIDLARGSPASVAAGFLSSLLDICSVLPLTLRDGQDRIQALWRTLVADSEGYPRPAPAELEACFHDWILKYFFYLKELTDDWPDIMTSLCSRFTKLSKESQSCNSLPDLAVGHEWWTRLQNTSSGKAFEELKRFNCINSLLRFEGAVTIGARLLFATTGGDIGYGPLSCVIGDEVWVLENGRIPFILRPMQDASSFELVGECYVHGIMDGQLLANGPPVYVPLSIV